MPYKTLTCEECGSEFEGWHSTKYCSDECKHLARTVQRTCEQCGSGFRVDKSYLDRDPRYCSQECSAKSQEVRETRTCKGCGEDFEVAPSKGRVFCGDGCKKRFYMVECEQCGDRFKPHPGSRETARFCSKECHGAHRGRDADEDGNLECIQCGEFKPTEAFHEDKTRRHSRRATCKECERKSVHYRRAAEESGSLTTEKLIKIRYREQGNYCVYCNAHLRDVEVHLDHKQPLSRGGKHTAANLQYTCRSCNLQKGDKTHAEYVDWRRDNDMYIHHLATE
jgi:5-methylcytosine-specific restriction endonuclease McrA